MGYRPPQRRAPRQQGAFLITLSVLTAIFFLLGCGDAVAGGSGGLRLGPTPTPTATARATYTPSPDARATHITEDMLTQVAVAATLFGQLTRRSTRGRAHGSVARWQQGRWWCRCPWSARTMVNLQPPGTACGEHRCLTRATAQATLLYIPNAANGQPLSPLPTLALLPPAAPPAAAGSPAAAATHTRSPIAPAAANAHPTPLPPTPTPMPATPTFVPVGQLAAICGRTLGNPPIRMRVGPSNAYTVAGTLNAGARKSNCAGAPRRVTGSMPAVSRTM